MKGLLKYHLYFIGFTVTILFSLWLNLNCPPNYDEAHAWNIARFISPAEIFTLSKTEGHPFLWYYLLMPIAKTNILYPYSLYLLNLIIALASLFLLYRYSPFPVCLKYLITFSAPFLQLYASFARSYTLTIFFLFALLSLYRIRHKKTFLYLLLLLLLANTNLMGIIAALPLGISFFCENLQTSLRCKHFTQSLILTICTALLEIALIFMQFYGYNKDIPTYTPTFASLKTDFNTAFYPLNAHLFFGLTVLSIFLFLKQKSYTAAFFLFSANLLLLSVFVWLYHGCIHHHNFFYIYLIAAYWLKENTGLSAKKQSSLCLLTATAFFLIFNPYNNYKLKDYAYLNSLKTSADFINRIFPSQPQALLILEHFDANIISPYLNPNITLLNQTMTDMSTLKAFEESLYHFYKKINPNHITSYLAHTPNTLLFRSCGEKSYYNNFLRFNKKYQLNAKYCLYSIENKDF